MSSYAYVAIDPQGAETRGTLDVVDQGEALRRIKEMGLFPTKVAAASKRPPPPAGRPAKPAAGWLNLEVSLPGVSGRVKAAHLAVFTRQLATLVEAGMPLLRSLRVLHEQAESRALKRVIDDLALSVESGNSFTDAVAAHPRVFNRLYLNMVKAGEIGGALEVSLRRLAEFMEKARKMKGKIKAAMFYPCSVLVVAAAVVVVLMAFVVPRFKMVFEGLGRPLHPFTLLVFQLSEALARHLGLFLAVVAAFGLLLTLALRTDWGRWSFDRFKLAAPILGPLFRKLSISRFSRTLGTLVSNGVPILQALTIVKETAGNVVIGRLIGCVHENVKQGEPIAPTLKASSVFPAMVAGMVEVGEQTGALPEMLMKVADTYDEEVDNAASALTSILEPVMILFLAVIVGSIVIAMFLPLIGIAMDGFEPRVPGQED